jgi:hypothetical protein
MNTEAFISAYNESRNGTDGFHFNPLYHNFLYSDGVKECAEAGCYWLLDILGTEITRSDFKRRDSQMCIVAVKVKDQEATITGEFEDGDQRPYKREVEYTDLPDGDWVFYVSDDGDGKLRCILPKEY